MNEWWRGSGGSLKVFFLYWDNFLSSHLFILKIEAKVTAIINNVLTKISEEKSPSQRFCMGRENGDQCGFFVSFIVCKKDNKKLYNIFLKENFFQNLVVKAFNTMASNQGFTEKFFGGSMRFVCLS